MPELQALSAEKLHRRCDPQRFEFNSTEELSTLDEVIGQDSAVRAVSLGIGIDSPGYHMYALGSAGTGKTTTIKRFLERKALDQSVSDDWLYINNLDDPDKPKALRLPAGLGCEFAADFAERTDWDDPILEKYARFIGTTCLEEGLRHFAPAGVARVIEHSARSVAHQRKLGTKFAEVVDLIRQASYWAGTHGHDLVNGDDVQRAIDEKEYRSNRIEERFQEMIQDGTILIDTQGEAVGQVNGISVVPLGDHHFGKPSRITARAHAGTGGLVHIDHEAKLGGRYAQDAPLSLSAHLAFEQLYEEVDGDSAASAELYALLSSLSGIPLRQDLAVTGSVNQHGQVQAIGGVNEKIEGFFLTCKQAGLSGTQGVLIPRDNAQHLMLRDEVVAAVERGEFHVYPVATVDEGISLFTGREAGEPDETGAFPEGSVNRAVQDRLRALAEAVKGEDDDGQA